METNFKMEGDNLLEVTTYNNKAVMESNKRQRNDAEETGRYKDTKSGLVHIGKIEEGDVARLHAMGYKILTNDRDELKRTLLYIQNNEPYLLTVPGKPIAKKKMTWT